MPRTIATSAGPATAGRFRAAAGLGLTSFALAAAAVWLLAVSVSVVPLHDPARVLFWRVVGGVLLALAAAGFAALRPGVRGTAERVVLGVTGGAATGIGLGAFFREARLATDGRFEGYIVLIAAALAAHGIASLLFALGESGAPAAKAGPEGGGAGA